MLVMSGEQVDNTGWVGVAGPARLDPTHNYLPKKSKQRVLSDFGISAETNNSTSKCCKMGCIRAVKISARMFAKRFAFLRISTVAFGQAT